MFFFNFACLKVTSFKSWGLQRGVFVLGADLRAKMSLFWATRDVAGSLATSAFNRLFIELLRGKK